MDEKQKAAWDTLKEFLDTRTEFDIPTTTLEAKAAALGIDLRDDAIIDLMLQAGWAYTTTDDPSRDFMTHDSPPTIKSRAGYAMTDLHNTYNRFMDATHDYNNMLRGRSFNPQTLEQMTEAGGDLAEAVYRAYPVFYELLTGVPANVD